MVGGERVGLVVVLLCLGVTNTQQWWGGRKLETVSARRLAGEAGPGPERRLFRRAGLTVQRQQEQQQAGPGRMFSPLFSQSASGQPGGQNTNTAYTMINRRQFDIIPAVPDSLLQPQLVPAQPRPARADPQPGPPVARIQKSIETGQTALSLPGGFSPVPAVPEEQPVKPETLFENLKERILRQKAERQRQIASILKADGQATPQKEEAKSGKVSVDQKSFRDQILRQKEERRRQIASIVRAEAATSTPTPGPVRPAVQQGGVRQGAIRQGGVRQGGVRQGGVRETGRRAKPLSSVSNDRNNKPFTRFPAKSSPSKPAPPKPAPVSKPPSTVSAVTSKAARRKFTKCHGRCVQKFCLPVGILSEFEKCKEKCKDICTTSQ